MMQTTSVFLQKLARGDLEYLAAQMVLMERIMAVWSVVLTHPLEDQSIAGSWCQAQGVIQ